MPLVWTANKFRSALLRRTKANELGSGCFGVVLELNPKSDRVVKFAACQEDGWPVFATYCATEGKNDPHLLRVHAMREVNAEHSTLEPFVIAVIERLVPIKYNDGIPQKIQDECELVGNMAYEYRDGDGLDTSSARKLKALNPELYSTVELLLVYALETESQIDLHSGNMMYRKSTNTLVITDPFSSTGSRGSTEDRRLRALREKRKADAAGLPWDRTKRNMFKIPRIKAQPEVTDASGQYLMNFRVHRAA